MCRTATKYQSLSEFTSVRDGADSRPDKRDLSWRRLNRPPAQVNGGKCLETPGPGEFKAMSMIKYDFLEIA